MTDNSTVSGGHEWKSEACNIKYAVLTYIYIPNEGNIYDVLTVYELVLRMNVIIIILYMP